MKILSINCSHHASICVVDKGEIIFYLESQRVDRKKYSNNIESAFTYLKDKEFDWCLYSGYENDKVSVDEYSRQINNIKNKYSLSWKNESFVNHHHLNHAACAFYNSGFKEAYCIVADGGGIPHYVKNKILGREILSIYKLSHPDKYELIHQVCGNISGKSFVENNQVSENTLSLGQLFDIVKNTFKSKEPGGVMALSAYGKRNKFINRILKINKNSFTTNTNTIYRMLSYTKKNNINFTKENISYRVQKDCESIIKFYIKKILKEEPNANICLSGGFFQNCVANYEFLKTSSNIYVDPWSHDGGTSIGAALMWYYICTKDENIRKLKNIYLGPEHEIKEFKKINVKIIDEDSWPTESVLTNKITNFKEVAELLANKNIVAIFQGRSEAGPRALGNRSLLYDARDPKAKEVINLIKKREWYRPYAGTILLEHANDWFDLRGKKETQFMSYALKVKKEKTDIIPGILHIDNTSRMQTLKYEDNHNYYNLLKEFYNLTNVPMLLNTSLNVAGEPLVETLQEAISFINNTNVNYLYLPEKNYLLIKNER
jgi:carbamoyltransferase